MEEPLDPLIGLPKSTGVYVPEDESVETASARRMSDIIRILEDPEEMDLGGAMRMVAIEIATTFGGTAYAVNGTKAINDRIKNLRELSKQIQESAEMSNRDILNFDGPRFQFVFRELILLFRNSVIKAGVPADTADHILRVFREEFLTREQDLRRETAKLDPSSMSSSSTSEQKPAPPTQEVPNA